MNSISFIGLELAVAVTALALLMIDLWTPLERKKQLKGDSATAEREIFGVTHAEVGAYLLGLWGIPFPIVEAVAFHHRPNEVTPESRPLVAAVHIASGLVEEMTATDTGRSGGPADSSGLFDVTFLRDAGLEESFKKSRETAEKIIGGVADRS